MQTNYVYKKKNCYDKNYILLYLEKTDNICF